jgi:hypothetical protein
MYCISEKQRNAREFCQSMNTRFITSNNPPEKIARDSLISKKRNELQYQQDLKRINKELF